MSILLTIVALFSIISSIAVLLSNNPVFSTLCLILVFFFTSLFLLFLGLDFIAFVFLIIYIGAIAVLFLFVVMMLRVFKFKENKTLPFSILFILFTGLILNFSYIYGKSILLADYLTKIRFLDLNIIKEITLFTVNSNAIGLHLYSTYGIIFILCGILLLIGMIGAIILTLYYSVNDRKQHDFKQVLTKYKKNVLLKINK